MAAQQLTSSPVDLALSEKRREAANKRWENSKVRELELEEGFEYEITHEDDSSEEESSEESSVECGDAQSTVRLPKTTAWRG